LSGEASLLKEYVIGTDVYDRKPPYHPSMDSIVRTEARRLRSKLKEYYESEAKVDSVFIYFRTGSYVPVFRMREQPSAKNQLEVNIDVEHPGENRGISIGVIPFIDLSDHPLATDCARGITEELGYELTRLGRCRVIAASFASQVIAEISDIPSLARKLGVQLLFEGTVRKENTQLRITSRVVDRDGFQLWSHRFDTEVDRHALFGITEHIASALISRTRPNEAHMRRPRSLQGSICPSILSAEAMIDEGTPTEISAALSKFHEIVKAVPGNARAHCGIGQCHYEIALSGNAGSANAVFQAKRATLQALALDTQLAAAHACLGSILALEFNWAAAKKSFEHALNLETDPVSYRQFALFLTVMGQFDEAWHYLRKAQRIDPFSHRQKLACMKFLYFSRRYEKAVECSSGPLVYGTMPLESRLYLAFAQLQLGRRDDARRLANSLLPDSVRVPRLMTYIAEVLARCGDTVQANQIAVNYKLRSQDSPVSKFRRASLEAALGEPQNATSLLTAARKEHEPELLWLAVDPRFDPICDIKQFERIGKKHEIRLKPERPDPQMAFYRVRSANSECVSN
jgi:TolB-like protein/tetratricopeptide (TPR) repeat protein